jgi:hypothetical protein
MFKIRIEDSTIQFESLPLELTCIVRYIREMEKNDCTVEYMLKARTVEPEKQTVIS